MGKRKPGPIIAQADFPLYFVSMVGDRNVLVAGGGGPANTGVQNAIDIFDLRTGDSGRLEAIKVKHQDTSNAAIMNGVVIQNGNDFVLAGGEDGDCQLYRIKYQLLKQQQSKSESLRKRKTGSEDSSASDSKSVSFSVVPESRIKTDMSSGGGFQKCVRFTSNQNVMVTGGADGYIRVWQHPAMTKLFEIKAHTNEIDDLDISPDNKQVISVSKDNSASVWTLKNGDKFSNLQWSNPGTGKYRYRAARYGITIGRDGKVDPANFNLFTAQIPVVRDTSAQPCYLTRWDCKAYKQLVTMKTGTEILSALAVSDNGIYCGVGTISGSVSVYIAFSLQKLYHLSECHSIFVTGLDFVSSSASSRCLMGAAECSLLSISADKSLQLHQVVPSGGFSAIWAIIGAVLVILILFVLLPSMFLNI